ncbi:septation protein SepH [soil metagenome]
MQDLQVIGVENGALLVASEDGERYRIPIDDVLQSKLRQSVSTTATDRKISPREIQTHIRGGMSAQDVASVTGAPLEYIERYEGPVLAEREYVIGSALAVPVHTALETDPEGTTFGAVIEQRLVALGASDERWASWKEEGTGWIVKLAFTANQIDHDARWQFDPKKVALSPMNNEAIQLSQQGEAPTALIPRLRAVSSDRSSDTTRFDSGAFLLDGSEIEDSPTVRASEPASESPGYEKGQTANLLEALRRRRGERESASYSDEELVGTPSSDHPSTGSIRLVNVSLDEYLDVPLDVPRDEPEASAPQQPQPQLKPARKGRASMPSWDDIVFGARPDDDLA